MANWFIKKLEKDIKNILIQHPFTKSLLNYYHIDEGDIKNNLTIEVKNDMGKTFSEGNGEVIRINKKILDKDFFNKNFHFIIHEFLHWLKRRNEEKFYFNDPEEIQSFAVQIAWEKIKGKNPDEIKNVFFPIISTHFSDKTNAERFFNRIINSADRIFNHYKKMQVN